METNQTLENINNSVTTGFKGVFKTVSKKDIFLSWVFITTTILSVLIIVFVNIVNYDLKEFIKYTIDLILKFLPSILGFTVSGYAIIIGFSQSSLLYQFTEKLSTSQYSLYQKISGSFALNILFQGMTLIFACIVSLISSLDEKKNNLFNLSKGSINGLNEIGAFLISFGLNISLLVVLQIVINVFSFSQLIQYQTNFDKIKKKSNK